MRLKCNPTDLYLVDSTNHNSQLVTKLRRLARIVEYSKGDVVPIARLEAFRALKLSRLESSRALKLIGQIEGVYGPRTQRTLGF